jgi:biuret amidohydrolase
MAAAGSSLSRRASEFLPAGIGVDRPKARDFVVNTKKRYDCFLGTDLDFLPRSHGIDTRLITGVNTNSCLLATTAAANVRDDAVIVVEDCVDGMDGPELHAAGLACIRTAFGFVLNTDAIMALEGLVPRRLSAG